MELRVEAMVLCRQVLIHPLEPSQVMHLGDIFNRIELSEFPAKMHRDDKLFILITGVRSLTVLNLQLLFMPANSLDTEVIWSDSPLHVVPADDPAYPYNYAKPIGGLPLPGRGEYRFEVLWNDPTTRETKCLGQKTFQVRFEPPLTTEELEGRRPKL